MKIVKMSMRFNGLHKGAVSTFVHSRGFNAIQRPLEFENRLSAIFLLESGEIYLPDVGFPKENLHRECLIITQKGTKS
jgi:hypothetical protein